MPPEARAFEDVEQSGGLARRRRAGHHRRRRLRTTEGREIGEDRVGAPAGRPIGGQRPGLSQGEIRLQGDEGRRDGGEKVPIGGALPEVVAGPTGIEPVMRFRRRPSQETAQIVTDRPGAHCVVTFRSIRHVRPLLPYVMEDRSPPGDDRPNRVVIPMWYLYGLALVAGIANAVQGGTNATLAKSLGQPFAAGLVVALGTGTTLLLTGLVTGRFGLPGLAQAAQVPAWAWFGGCLGALVVLSQFFAAQQIGAAPFLAILVTAGVATSILLDHFGWIGFAVHAATPWRIVGGLLMIAGVTLVALF